MRGPMNYGTRGFMLNGYRGFESNPEHPMGEITPDEAKAFRTYSALNTVFSLGIGMLIGYAIWGRRR